MTNDERYTPVAQTLPSVLPALDRATGTLRAKQLVKRFGKLGLGSPNQQFPASIGTWGWSKGRRVWVSPKPTSGHYKGWGRLIHDVSHLVFAARHPSFKPHDGGHATLEREIAEYVVAKGWLAPRRKVEPKTDPKRERYERKTASLKRWESKLRRAQTAIKKLKRSIARHERDSLR